MKGVLIFIGTVAVCGLGYYVHKKSKPSPVINDTLPPASILDYNKVLKYGTTGEEVKELQRRLGGLTVDGIFGSKTQAKLKTVKGVAQTTLAQL